MQDHVGCADRGEQGPERGEHGGSAERRATGEFSQRFAGFGGIDVDAAENFEPRLFRRELQRFETDRAEPKLDDFDFFHAG